MSSGGRSASYDRVSERRRAVALARHFREAEGHSTAQIAHGLERSPATIKAYFYDPTGEKARAVKALCRAAPRVRRLHAATQRRTRSRLRQCLASRAIGGHWTHERVLDAMRDWIGRYGRPPTSYDWSSTHARRRGGEALARLDEGEWPAASVVTRLFGTWSAARAVAAEWGREMTSEPASASSSLGRESIPLPKPPESAAICEDLRGGEPEPEPVTVQSSGTGAGIPGLCSESCSHGSCRGGGDL
jgi:hypothetical protein